MFGRHLVMGGPRIGSLIAFYLLAVSCPGSVLSSYILCGGTFNSTCVSQLCRGQGKPPLAADVCRKEEGNSSEPALTLKDCYIDKNATGCQNKKFQGAFGEHKLGTVNLKIFQNKPTGSPLQLNISLLNAKWKQFKFRLMSPQTVLCRSLLLSDRAMKVVAPVRDHVYDCRLLVDQNMDTDMILDYEATDGVEYEQGLLKFHVPPVPSLGAEVQEMLLYVERIGSQFILHWLQSAACYQVEVFRDSVVVKSVLLGPDGAETDACPETPQVDEKYASYSYDSFDIPGHYKFKVQEATGNCSSNPPCPSSESPVISRVTESVSRVYLYIIVGVMAVLCIFFFGCFWVLFHSSRALSSKPKVLFLYSPTRPTHVALVQALALYMRNSCKVMALMDVLDIYLHNERNPINWYNWALLNADCVFVISSPPQSTTSSRRNEGIFQHLDSVGIRYLEDRLSDSRLIAASIILPYCSRLQDRGLPKVAWNLRNYNLLRDFDKILWTTRGKYLVPQLLFQHFPHPGGGRALKKKGTELLEALRLAEKDMMDDPPDPSVESVAWKSALVPEPVFPDIPDQEPISEVIHEFAPPTLPRDLLVDEENSFPGLLLDLDLSGGQGDTATGGVGLARSVESDDNYFFNGMNLSGTNASSANSS